MSGTVPVELENLKDLEYLYLQQNGQGRVPDSILNLPNLKRSQWHHNYLANPGGDGCEDIYNNFNVTRKIYVSQKYRVFFSKTTTHVYHKLTLKKTNKSLLVLYICAYYS